ncbi:hypothetical protein BZL41_04005 [Pseudomonas sp. PIC25]|nr:hypothetical protein BZL41_04005 [Pseudomonas sp. PIC25]
MTGCAMSTMEKLDSSFQAVEALCAERSISVVRLEGGDSDYLGVQLKGDVQEWDLEVNCKYLDLTRLPTIKLRTPRGLLPHVGYHGTICVSDGHGLSLDPDRFPDIVAFTVLAAYDLLEKWSADPVAATKEFYNELEGYWLGLPSSELARATINVDRNDRLVSVYLNSQVTPRKWYVTNRDEKLPWEFETKKLAPHRALYVHLDEPVPPPTFPAKLDATFIDAVLAKLSPVQNDLWSRLVGPSKNGPKQVALFVSTPRDTGGLSIVGAMFGARDGKIDSRQPVTPLTVRRHSPAYMRERGGASLDLYNKHVVVIGCGSVGSIIADSLAAAGVGRLTLVDPDTYSEDNVFRHTLDPAWIDFYKITGLKYLLERHYPGIQVQGLPWYGQEWLAKASLDDVDAIVFALGLPTLERVFCRQLRTYKKRVPMLFSWLDPLDLGGHSVTVWSEGTGCLDCLYRDDEGLPSLSARTSFLEPNQPVSKNLTGCYSTFVPYGALQARHTGLIATEHLLSALQGEGGASYRYWVGDGKTAIEQGLRATAWWKEARSVSHVEAAARAFGRPCKLCRGGA